MQLVLVRTEYGLGEAEVVRPVEGLVLFEHETHIYAEFERQVEEKRERVTRQKGLVAHLVLGFALHVEFVQLEKAKEVVQKHALAEKAEQVDLAGF